MNLIIEPISKRKSFKNFNSGIEELDIYLRKYALKNDKKNIGKTFIALSEENSDHIIGYYTVSMAQFSVMNLSDKMKKGLPLYHIPAMRIGKLAIDKIYQGKGIGSKLLKDALIRAANISKNVAIYCVLVDAINNSAKSFYESYGFIPFNSDPLILILPIKTILKTIE